MPFTRFHTPTRIIRRFTSAFQKVWNQIRERDRIVLKELWKPARESEVDGLWSCIAVLDDLPTGIAGICEPIGGQISFDIFFINEAKPSAVANVIAHELGHAISIPHGWMQQHRCSHQGDCVACECRAYSYMAAWGFDPFLNKLPKRKRLNHRFKAIG